MDEKLMEIWKPYFEFQRLFLRNATQEQTMMAILSIFKSGCNAQSKADSDAVKQLDAYCYDCKNKTLKSDHVLEALAAAEIKEEA